MTKRHWHVHSIIPGYLCNCDWHAPLDAAERDDALRAEKRYWQDFKYEVEEYGCARIRITGSIREGGYDIDNIDSTGWRRSIESWECREDECYEGEAQ